MNFLNTCYETSLVRHVIGNVLNFVRFEFFIVMILHILCLWIIASCS
jgi:hypothetical protein